jgi:hypothetical protein
MLSLLRILFIVSFAFWQGGFMFYGAVVVPIGSEILGSDLEQGFITQRVTIWLNISGLVCLAIWLWLIRVTQPRDKWDLLLWLILMVCLVSQFLVHAQMSRFIDSESHQILDRVQLKRWHPVYLSISTLQWFVALILLGWQIRRMERCNKIVFDEDYPSPPTPLPQGEMGVKQNQN